MRKRGYTLEQVSEVLRGKGLDITERTLRNYLQRRKAAGDTGTDAAEAKEPGEGDLDKYKFKDKI